MSDKKSAAIKWTIKFCITIGLFVLLFRPDWFGLSKRFINVELTDVLDEIRGLNLGTFVPWILAAFVIKGTGMLASMRRWDLLLRGQGIVVPFKHLAGTFLVGRFFGAFLPSTIGLDAYRTYDISRHSKLIGANVGVFFVEKIIGLFSLSLLLFVTAPFGVRFVGPTAVTGLLILFAIPVSVCFLILLFPGAIVWILDRSFLRIEILERRLRSAVDAVAAYRHQRPLLLRAVGYGIIVHSATAFMYFATARAIAADVALGEILFVAPVMIAATVGVPVSMGGEGIREGTFIYLLNLVGIASASAFVLSHLGFWVGEIISLAGGVIYMLRPAGYRPDLSGHAVESLHDREPDTPEPSTVVGFWKCKEVRPSAMLSDALLLSVLAGMAVGVCESILILLSYADQEWGVVWFAVLTYGLAGLGAGLGLSVVLTVLGKWEKTFHEALPTICATSVFGLFSIVIARFRIRRDVFSEHAIGKLGLLMDVGLLALAGIFVLVLGIALTKWWWTPSSRVARSKATILMVLLILVSLGSWMTVPEDPREAVSDLYEGTKPVLTLEDAPNILLVVADALRWDALGCQGAPGNPTPNLDAFAGESIRFDTTIAQASWTRPSFATIFSSRYPSSHNTKYKFSQLPGDLTTLAEALQAAGYQTLGIANNTNVAPAFNYHQGFDDYIYLAPDPFFGASSSASRLVSYQILRKFTAQFGPAVPDINFFYRDAAFVNDVALQAISELDPQRPAFVFVHYMEPHDPYIPHPNDGSGVARARTPKPKPEEVERLRSLYDGEIRYMDTYFGKLLESIQDSPYGKNLSVMFTADHGEEFYDHQGWWHGTTLYEEAIHVPLMIRFPDGNRGGEVVKDLSRLLDVTPTILQIAGVSVPEEMQGRNLLTPVLTPLPYVFAEEDHEGNILYALRGNRWKFIEANPKNRRGLEPSEMYDLELDPVEADNLAGNESLSSLTETLGGELNSAKDQAAEGAVVGTSTTIDSELEEQMGALGYT